MPPPPTEVDVVVVGGGAAGCVVAGRLAKADPNLQIAILESGVNNKDYPTSIQPAMYLSHIAPTSTTGAFYVGKKSAALNDRESIVPTGGMLGGGSSINFMMYTRGSASDYDDWKTEGWTYNDILPLARKMETCHLPDAQDPELHGFDGPLHVSYGGHRSEIGRQFVTATKESTDVPFKHDIQDFKTGHGVTNWAKWISPKTGRRQDAAHCYVHPVAESQTNIHLITEQRAIRVLFEGTKAVGVEYCPNKPDSLDQRSTIKARKMVVVSSGALGTPQILERSGVGAKEVLQKLDIDVVSDLKVGFDYQDHQLTLATYEVDEDEDTLDDYLRGVEDVHAKVGPAWTENGSGIVASNVIDAGMKVRPNEQELAEMGDDFKELWESYFKNAPDKPVMFGGAVSSFLGDHSLLPPGKKFMMMGSYLMYPASRGHIHVTSKNPFEAPDFDPAFLSHPADMGPQVWMYKKLREIARRMPTYRGEVAAIHPKFSETSAARCREYAAPLTKAKGSSVNLATLTPCGLVVDGEGACNHEDGQHISSHGGGGGIQDLVYTAEDNAAIEDWLRTYVQTTWHSMATCPMKAKDEGGVVDPRLNVHGTSNLKVADLSICPANVGSNTYSVALTVGEKAAILIAEDLGIKGV